MALSKTTSPAQSMQPLDSFGINLKDSILIEASAGTGKTYAITILYLRLLLGLRDNNTLGTPLSVEQILVVTYTIAATEELRDRIRSSINELRIHCIRFKADPKLVIDSRFLPLLNQIERHDFLEQAIDILVLAEQEMDKASIFTIHGFCQRILNDLALESNNLFEFEILTQTSELLKKECYNFWRRFCYRIPHALHAFLLNTFPKPDDLLAKIRTYLEDNLYIFSEDTLESNQKSHHLLQTQVLEKATSNNRFNMFIDLYNNLSELSETILKQIKEQWNAAINDANSVLNDFINSPERFRKGSYPIEKIDEAVLQITIWAKSEDMGLDKKLISYLKMFSQAKFDSLNPLKNKVRPQMALFETINKRFNSDNSDNKILTPLIDNFLKIAIIDIKENIIKSKKNSGLISFYDLINHLDNAIINDKSDFLKTKIQSNYPVGLIDEFQDTDKIQYRIFSAIYNHAYQPVHDKMLLMIGDPKQAIYGFRGADIFAYMSAKNDALALYTLDTNYRSAPQVIESVNRLFSMSDNPFLYDFIPFVPVKARDFKNTKNQVGSAFIVNDEIQPGLSLLRLSDELIGMTDYREHAVKQTVAVIANWLNLAEKQRVFINDNETKRPISVNDIAILVYNSTQADALKKELNNYNINSVYSSDSENVFSTIIAMDILRLLKAVHNHNDERLIREALGSNLFQLTSLELHQFIQDENAWEEILQRFEIYHIKWQKYGVMALLREILIANKLAEKWYAAGLGERVLMDYLHIAELLQEAELNFQSPSELLQWMIEQAANETVGDKAQLRLESDKNVIKIVTIHKSKGLEYPIVFYPFAMNYRDEKNAKLGFFDDSSSQHLIDIADLKSENRALSESKRNLAESIRLAYVALTRAKYHCVIGVADVKYGNGKKSVSSLTSFGKILGLEENATDFHERLDAFVTQKSTSISGIQHPIVDYLDIDSLTDTRPVMRDNTKANMYQAQTFNRELKEFWTLSSYSHLVYKHHKPTIDFSSGSFKNNKLEEVIMSSLNQNAQNAQNDLSDFSHLSAYTFPRGANAGIFLHSLLEHPERYLFAQSDLLSKSWRDALERFSLHLGVSEEKDSVLLDKWREVLFDWLYQIYHSRLEEAGTSLSGVDSNMQSKELHFHLSMPNRMNADDLNNLLIKHDALSAKASPLTFDEVQGMLQGFIDLVFMHDGKFYIVDYKSNHLGNSAEQYNNAAMQLAMISHRYDLQYQLYTVALHRYLQQRIENYDYDTHFGGVYYLFIRAMSEDYHHSTVPDAKNQRPGIFYTRPSYEFINALDELLG